MLLMTTSVVV